MEKFDYLGLSGRQLKLFLAVLDKGSLSAASEELDLNQSTVSYTLERLRDALGDPLFVKSGRGVTPTSHAHSIAPRIRELLVDLESIAAAGDFHAERQTQPIVIATNVMEWLPQCDEIFRNIRAVAPHVPIGFRELGSRENIFPLLDSQNIDLAITVRSNNLPAVLNRIPLYKFPQVCFFDPSQRGPVSTPEEYSAAVHAVMDFGGTTKSTIDSTLDSLSLSRRIGLRAPNIHVLANMMLGTEMITTMQVDLARHALSKFDYCTPPISVPEVQFDLVWHRRSEQSGRHIWLRNLVQNTIVHQSAHG